MRFRLSNIIISVFLITPIFLFISSKQTIPYIVYAYYAVNFGFFVLVIGDIKRIAFTPCFFFCILLALLGVLKFLLYGSSLTLALTPLTALIGYSQLVKRTFSPTIFLWWLFFFYLYFALVYFFQLPSLFNRSEFFEESTFEISSSNAIAISLNFILFFYMLCRRWLSIPPDRLLLALCSFNLFLILVQGSRIGIFVALLLIVMCGISNYRGKLISVMAISAVFCWSAASLVISMERQELFMVGATLFNEYGNDSRGIIFSIFFENLTFERFFWGYEPGFVYHKHIDRTHNVMLSLWNTYGVFSVLVVIFLVFWRIFICRSNANMPRYFLFPVVAYGLVEQLFLPSYWDPFLLLLLFPNVSVSHLANSRSPASLVATAKSGIEAAGV